MTATAVAKSVLPKTSKNSCDFTITIHLCCQNQFEFSNGQNQFDRVKRELPRAKMRETPCGHVDDLLMAWWSRFSAFFCRTLRMIMVARTDMRVWYKLQHNLTQEMWTEWHPLKVESVWTLFQELTSTVCHALFFVPPKATWVFQMVKRSHLQQSIGQRSSAQPGLWHLWAAGSQNWSRSAIWVAMAQRLEGLDEVLVLNLLRGMISRTCLICFDYLIRIKVYQESSNPKHGWCDPQEDHRHRCLEGIDFLSGKAARLFERSTWTRTIRTARMPRTKAGITRMRQKWHKKMFANVTKAGIFQLEFPLL